MFLVCGGGPAGIAAAMMAGRQGANVLLVERYGRLGGMAVQAMVGPLMGKVKSEWVDRIVEALDGRRVDYEFADLKYAAMLEEAGVDILLHAAVAKPLRDGNRVTGARLLTKQGLIDVPARVVIDGSGDGDVAFGAGAEFEQGRDAGPNWSVDGTKVRDLTKAELEGRRQVEPIVAFLRKNAPGFKDAYVSGMPAVIGVRETRRILGDDYLTVREIVGGVRSPNAVVRGAEFGIDIHNPDGIGQAQGVSSDHPLGKDPKLPALRYSVRLPSAERDREPTRCRALHQRESRSDGIVPRAGDCHGHRTGRGRRGCAGREAGRRSASCQSRCDSGHCVWHWLSLTVLLQNVTCQDTSRCCC